MSGGGVHRRAAGVPKAGRAWEAGRARPSQEDSAAALARRSWGTGTWQPGVTRGGAARRCRPAAEPPCPSCPALQQWLMPQPRLLNLGHEGTHSQGRAHPECRCWPLAGSCVAEPRAERSWAAPGGASCRMAGAVAHPRGGGGSSP